jgi:hypothetical protein
MAPRAASDVSSYKSTTFAPQSTTDRARETVNNAFDPNFGEKYDNIKPALEKTTSSGIVDKFNNPVSSSTSTPAPAASNGNSQPKSIIETELYNNSKEGLKARAQNRISLWDQLRSKDADK